MTIGIRIRLIEERFRFYERREFRLGDDQCFAHGSISQRSYGLAIRTKMSWSDGRVTSKWYTAARALSRARNACGSPASRTSCIWPKSLTASTSGRSVKAAAPSEVRILTVSAPYAILDALERAVEHLAAAEDHEDPIAHPLGGGHVVGAEHDSRAAAAHFEHGVFEHLRVDRIETGERLVKNQERRIRHHRGDELHLLRHALRERLDLSIEKSGQLHPLHPVINRRVDARRRLTLEPPVVAQQAANRHLLVEPALLRQVADLVARGRRVA